MEHDRIVRIYSISTGVSIDALILSLRSRKVNGELKIVLSQGGTRQITFEEQAKVASSKTPEMVEILNKV